MNAEEEAVAYFKLLLQDLSTGTNENDAKQRIGCLMQAN
jgi:hypothetical protein